MIVFRASYLSTNKLRSQFGRQARAAVIGKTVSHLKYIQHRRGDDRERGGRDLYDSERDRIDGREVRVSVLESREKSPVFHRLIISPDINPRDMKEFTREVMDEFSRNKDLEIRWVATSHTNTDNHHSHVLIWGRDKKGKQVRIERDDFVHIRKFADEYLERTHPEERKRYREEKLREHIARLDERTDRSALAWRNVGLTRERLREPYADWKAKEKEREREREASYSNPIKYRESEFSRKSSLDELVELKQASKEKYADRLDRKDAAKLDRWIEDKRFEQIGVSHEERQNIPYVVYDNKVYSKASKREDLLEVRSAIREADRLRQAEPDKLLQQVPIEIKREDLLDVPNAVKEADQVRQAFEARVSQLPPSLGFMDRDKLDAWSEDKTRAHHAELVRDARKNAGDTVSPLRDTGMQLASEMGQFAASIICSIPSDLLERDTLRDVRDHFNDLRQEKLDTYRQRTDDRQRAEDDAVMEKIEKARDVIEKMMFERDHPRHDDRVKFVFGDELDLEALKKEKSYREREEEMTDWFRGRGE